MDLVNNSIYLKKPTYKELYLTQELLACEQTMAFNNKWGGTVSFPKSEWNDFYDRYLSEESENIYFHIYNLDNVFVGEVSSRLLSNKGEYSLNIKVKHDYRGNKHAKDVLDLYFGYLFEQCNAKRIIDNVASDNLGAISLLTTMGMTLEKETPEASLFVLNKEDYI